MLALAAGQPLGDQRAALLVGLAAGLQGRGRGAQGGAVEGVVGAAGGAREMPGQGSYAAAPPHSSVKLALRT